MGEMKYVKEENALYRLMIVLTIDAVKCLHSN